jgi:serine/threonine-protein kinase
MGKFQLLSEIATGGMAEIWIAKQQLEEGIEKLVVIKMLRPKLKRNREFVHMFLNEARIAARLKHRNVVQMYDLGYADGNYFIAMEYIHGENLRNTTKACRKTGEKIPLAYSLTVMSQACEGLHYAHTKTDVLGRPLNIVHCDMSPQNIVISFRGEIKLVDFGVAKAASRFEQAQKGVVKGKLAYMSPEQIQGKPMDARSDIFSAGIVLWELATWKRLFGSFTPNEIVKLIPSGHVPSPRRVNPEVTPALEAVILKALEKDPLNRFQTAQEMHAALQEVIGLQPAPAKASDLSEFMRRIFEHKLDSVRKIEKAQEDGELGSFLFHDLRLEDEEMASLGDDFAAEVSAPPPEPTPPAPAKRIDVPAPGPARPKPPPLPDVKPQPPVAKPRSFRPAIIIATAAILLGAATYLLIAWQADLWPFSPPPAETGKPPDAAAAKPGTIHVASTPKGAGVLVNEKMRCSTPCVVDKLKIDQPYLLEIKLEGYRPWTAEFTLEKGFEVRRFDATLQKESPKWGSVTVVTKEPGGRVELNEKRFKRTTPMTIKKVLAGRKHSLRVSFDEREWVTEFEVKPGQHLKLIEPGTPQQK